MALQNKSGDTFYIGGDDDQAWRFFLLCDLFVTQTYSSSDFFNGISDI
ncbi:MAG: hypothetical protein P8L72_05565 [Flavobacteriaceae bacterium]|nr:hypothetical protein [Flavobacteriaceae bacterium]MDG2314829.1 hypothetical protein [Flavobacteriaceae bacterium]